MKSVNPTVSVVIPVFNAEKTIRRCVESVVLGTCKNVEVILVDDCSTDNSLQLCYELSDDYKNVRVIRNEKNSGVSYTRNHGIKEATGEFLAFVDSDDWVSKHYASKLVEMAADRSEDLVICSFKYIDRVSNSSRIYRFDKKSEINRIETSEIFELFEKFLMQSIFNKVFKRNVVIENHLQFNINQSMGEDFQFVLDYIEAAGCRFLTVYNSPLYYYIRHNNGSLISHFGFTQRDDEYDRINQLYRISGKNDESVRNKYIERLNNNYIYQIIRNTKYSRKQKYDAITKITGSQNARSEYRKQIEILIKEKIASFPKRAKKQYSRAVNFIHRKRRENYIRSIRDNNSFEDLSILSQNCIGGVVYHDLGMKFHSPTVNIFIRAQDFVKFVLNLDHYINVNIQMAWEEEYPVGYLEDLTIYFMHYDTCKEAKAAWERRTGRIIPERILVLSTDRDGFDDAVYADWQRIEYPKILFTARSEYYTEQESVYYPQFTEQGYVSDLIPDRLFYKDDVLINKLKSI